ncbi:DNA-DIRECTED RNA polymerase [Salix viminalis]|uniref:DNA-directed RNA polymerase n=1 Tax=Salix viminalis TaxID=40686 RepID=A0A9Q0QAR0_SALVM|nr:DNA-DIRECTED RNA polymerase [Salix viminalis]
MDENSQSSIFEGEITGIRFGLATQKEICTASISDCPISHSSQLTNPFLGLPLEFGKCESCGTSEPGKCEGHFGYIDLPIPIYHPSHISELKRMLSLICLKCLKLKRNKIQIKSNGIAERLLSCCEECAQISIREVTNTDGACFLELKLPSRSRLRDGCWNFLERYGFRYGDDFTRPLLPCEVMQILKRFPLETRKKLSGKGYFPQDGYILQQLPVPPNCLSVPVVSDGDSIMSSDLSISMLKKVLKQAEVIKNSRSGAPNFDAHKDEANSLAINGRSVSSS